MARQSPQRRATWRFSCSNSAAYLAQVEALLDRYEVHISERVTVRHWNTAVSFASIGRAFALVPGSFVNGATSAAVIPFAEAEAELVTWLLHPEELSAAASLVLEIASLIDSEAGASGSGLEELA